MSLGGRVAAAAAACLLASGCGAAYYGTALGIIATQEDKRVQDQSFPDAALTNDVVPAFVGLELSAAQVTLSRDLSTFNPSGAPGGGTQSFTDFEVLGFAFPPGYGTARSNRDAGTTLLDGDRLVVRINDDVAQEVVFGLADVAATGSDVAGSIMARVRALTPVTAGVPLEAYTGFVGTFDEVSGSYFFQSGSPGEDSEVVFEPAPRQGGDDVPDNTSTLTAERLGLGVAQGGIETNGGDSVGFTVINRGTDTITGGTVELFLSRDKVLDRRVDLPLDTLGLDRAVAVGQALTYVRRNGAPPPARLLRGDLLPGAYYLIFSIADTGGEASLDDNVMVSSHTVEVVQPVDDPATPTAEVANVLDIVPVATSAPVAVVTGNTFSTVVTLSNVGAPVVAPVDVDLDVVLSTDAVLDGPAAFLDPAGVLAGVYINPTDPTQPIIVRVLDTGAGPMSVGVAGNVVTVQYDPGAPPTVLEFINLLSNLTIIDVFDDGNGDTSTDTLDLLLAAAGETEVTARDVFIAHRRVQFTPTAGLQLRTQSFGLEATMRTTALRTTLLPIKLTPIFRARPVNLLGDPQDPATDVRRAANFVRVYDRTTATFDSVTGATLPTVNSDDFAALDAVTLRPVNTGSIRQGQQRVFRFEIPATGLTLDESQLLVILRTENFDARMDLLSASGDFIVGTDDGPLGQDPMLYTAVQSNSQSRSFYLVVSTARADESDLRGGNETFELTISVNPRDPGDSGLVAAVDAGNLLRQLPQSYAPGEDRTVNDVIVPFSLANSKAEICVVLPQRARVRFVSRPVFQVGVRTVITRFVKGFVPSPVDQQAVLDPTATGIVYRPAGSGPEVSHVLEGGVYIVAFETSGGVPDTQDLRFELTTLFLPND